MNKNWQSTIWGEFSVFMAIEMAKRCIQMTGTLRGSSIARTHHHRSVASNVVLLKFHDLWHLANNKANHNKKWRNYRSFQENQQKLHNSIACAHWALNINNARQTNEIKSSLSFFAGRALLFADSTQTMGIFAVNTRCVSTDTVHSIVHYARWRAMRVCIVVYTGQ